MREITLRKIRNNLPQLVHAQLPRTIGENLSVRIECDSAMLKVYAILTDWREPARDSAKQWRFELQDGTFEGRPAKCRLRDEDISLLCVSV